jgi:hypothetical protein
MQRSQVILLSGVIFTLTLIAALTFGFYAYNSGLLSFTVEQPKLQLQFHTAGDQDKAVAAFFARFANAEKLSFKNTTPQPPPELGPRTFSLDMTHGDLAAIKVRSVTQPSRFFVFIYEEKPDPALNGIIDRLTAQLRAAWPDTAEVKAP